MKKFILSAIFVCAMGAGAAVAQEQGQKQEVKKECTAKTADGKTCCSAKPEAKKDAAAKKECDAKKSCDAKKQCTTKTDCSSAPKSDKACPAKASCTTPCKATR